MSKPQEIYGLLVIALLIATLSAIMGVVKLIPMNLGLEYSIVAVSIGIITNYVQHLYYNSKYYK